MNASNSELNGVKDDSGVPLDAKASVLVQSAPIPQDAIPVRGPDLSTAEMKYVVNLLDSYKTIGFQATSLHRAIEIVQNMVGMSITRCIN
jgi:deoxyhypusine synthase